MYKNPFENTPIGTKPQPGTYNDPFMEGSPYRVQTQNTQAVQPSITSAKTAKVGSLKLTAPKIDIEAPAGQAITAPKIEGETPTTGFLKFLSPFARAGQKAFNVISEAVTGGLNRLDKFFDVVTTKEAPLAEKVIAGTEAVLGMGTVAFSPVMAMFDAAEELPIIKYAAKPANWALQKLGEAGAWAGGTAVDAINFALPGNYKLNQGELDRIKPIAQEVGSLFTMIKGIELTTRVVGGKKVGPETQKLLDKGREAPDTLTPYEKLEFNSVVDSLKADNFWNKGIIKTFQEKLGIGIEKLKAGGEIITHENVDKIISDAVKQTELPVNPGEMTIPVINAEPIKIATDNKIVLQKLIRNNENIDYVKVKTLGNDINGDPIASTFKWDYKKQKATIYVTNGSTAENIAHELGHYFDHTTSSSTQRTLSELMINKGMKPKAIERSLTAYVVKNKGGNISAKEITKGVKESLAKMENDIQKLAGPKATPQEKFARAFSKVTTDPTGSAKIAPEFSSFVQYALAKEGMPLPKPKVTTMGVTPKGILSPAESRKIGMDNIPSDITNFKEKTISIRIANELVKRGMDPTEAGTLGDHVASRAMQAVENAKGVAEKTQAFVEAVQSELRGTIMKELPGEKQQAAEYLKKRGATKFRETEKGIAPYIEKNGQNLIEIENADLTLPELRRKLVIANEGKDIDVANIVKKDITSREKGIIPQDLQPLAQEARKYKSAEEVEAFRMAGLESQLGGKITPEQEKQIKALNKKIFGDEDVKITEQILTPEGRKALGSYKERIIKILAGQGDAKASFYHEAVHKYLDVLTTQAEQVDLILEAKKRFAVTDFKQAEEILAEKFINYAKSREGVAGTMKLMFDKILVRIKKYLGNADTIDTFYTEILAGKVTEGPRAGWGVTTTGPPLVAGTGLKTGRFVEGRSAFNLDKINAPQDVEKIIKTIAKESDQFKAQRISKTNADIEKLAFEVGVTPEDLIKTQPGSIANAETVLKARKLVMDMATDLRNTIRETTTEIATPEQLKTLRAKVFRLQGTMKAVAGLRTEASNVFRQFQIEAAIGENDIMRNLLSELKIVDAESAGDIAKFSKKVKEVLEPTIADKAWHLWYMNILSGVSTQIKNVFGNITNLGAEITRIAVTKPAELPKAIEGLYQGLIKGREKAAGILKEGEINKFEERGIKPIVFTGSTPLGKAIATGLNSLDYVGRFMSAADALFREGFKGMELYGQAREIALKEGLTGDALNKRIADIAADPLQEMIESVDQFAKRGVYTQQPTGLMGWLSSTMSRATTSKATDTAGMKITKGVARTIVPFTRIIANVVNNGLDWTPAGFMREGLPKNLWERKALSRIQYQELGRAAMGTIAMTYLASLAANGLLSGNGPREKKERDILIASGWRQNSVKVGDTWYPYSNWGPLTIPMALVGNYNDAMKYGNMNNKDTFERTTAAVLNTVQSILDMSFLSGLSDLMTAISDQDPTYFKRYIASQVTTPVPNLFKQVARFFDTTQYEANTIQEYILSNLRITGGLKPRLNVFGNVVKGEELTQLQPVRETSDPVIKYLAEKELWISIPSKATMVVDRNTGEKRQMTPDEYYEYVKISGKAIKEVMDRDLDYIRTLEEYPDKQQDFIDKIVQTERDRAKMMIQ